MVDFLTAGSSFEMAALPIVSYVKATTLFEGSNTRSVTVYGKGFYRNMSYTCEFQDTVHLGRWSSDDAIECLFSIIIPEGSKLLIRGNNIVLHKSHFIVNVKSKYDIMASVPDSASIHGGSRVTIFGTNFVPSAAAVCRFGFALVPASYINASAIFCHSPAHDIGTVKLDVSMNGWDYSSSTLVFHYRNRAFISGVSPSGGWTIGGRVVHIFGNNFQKNNDLLCRFGTNAASRGTFISSEEIQCISPANAAGFVAVAISLNGIDFIDDGFEYDYRLPVRISSITPVLGSTGGGTEVLVSGSNFVASMNLVCKFGEQSPIAAVFMSNSTVVCVSPKHTPGSAALRVSNNGVQFSDSTASFKFVPSLVLSDVSPSTGSVLGGTAVKISINNLPFSGSLRCRFGNASVLAAYVDMNHLSCVSPAGVLGATTLSVSLNGLDYTREANSLSFVYELPLTISSFSPVSGHAGVATLVNISGTNFKPHTKCRFSSFDAVEALYISDTLIQCTSPKTSKRSLALDITNNMVDFSRSTLSFVNRPNAFVASIFPTAAKEAGGTFVKVRGSHFKSSENLTCLFDNVRSPFSQWVSASEIHCKVPAGKVSDVVQVRVSNNGQVFSSTSASFEFLGDLSVNSLSPASGPVLGGTSVFVYGHGFVFSNHIKCKFNYTQVAAVFINSTCLLCTTPSQYLASSVSVSVSNNGKDFPKSIARFDYAYLPRISAIGPTLGPVYGNFNITVHGTYFTAGTKCYVDDKIKTTIFVSESKVLCEMSSNEDGVVNVQVSNNGQDFSARSLQFEFKSPPAVFTISPFTGNFDGGAMVVVHGDRFDSARVLKCRFGNAGVVPAHVLDRLTLKCVSPKVLNVSDKLAVSFQVTDGAEMFSSNQIIFTYHKAFDLVSLSPTMGYVSGATNVQITGNYFLSTLSLHCVFGMVRTRAEYISAQNIACLSPVSTTGNVSVHVLSSAEDEIALKPSQYLTFTYVNDPTIESIFPPWTSTQAGTLLDIWGTNFIDSGSLLCKFGNTTTTSAIFVSAKLLQCIVPTLSLGIHVVEITANGNDFTSCQRVLKVYAPEVLTSIVPNTMIKGQSGKLILNGAGFLRSSLLKCRFGEQVVVATFISDSAVECTAPALNDSVMVQISNNGQIFSSEDVLLDRRNDIVLTSLHPRFGPFDQASLVTIVGTGFESASSVKCRFGEHMAPGSLSGQNDLTCLTPLVSVSENVSVEITTDGTHFTSSGLTFSYLEKPKLISISPIFGFTDQNIPIRVTGINFKPSSYLGCKIGYLVNVRATYINSTTISCTVRSSSPMSESLQITNNGRAFTEEPIPFSIVRPMRILSISPSSGPSIGGTRINIMGTYFKASTDALCKFGSKTSVATFISATRMICHTPAHMMGPMDFQLSLNGKYFQHSSMQFHYHAPNKIESISPSFGSVNGGTKIIVNVRACHFSQHLVCRFANTIVHGSCFNETAVSCISPRHDAGDVELQISNNGFDFISSSYSFVYKQNIVITRTSPSKVISGMRNLVNITGSNFVPGTQCKYKTEYVLARYISASLIQCELTFKETGKAKIFLSTHLTPEMESMFSLAVVSNFLLKSLHPAFGQELGGTSVKIIGNNFINSASLMCSFAALKVQATWKSSTEIRCVTPKHIVGISHVSVLAYDRNFSNALPFQFVTKPEVTSIFPAFGIIYGKTWVTVSISNIENTNFLSCRFGNTKVVASYISTTLLRCQSPAMDPGTVSLSVSLNGVDYHGSLPFRYIFPPSVLQISPTLGETLGGTVVTVTGFDFIQNVTLCKFGSIVSSMSSVISSKQLRCTAPPVSSTRVVTVYISNNQQDYTATASRFTYVNAAIVNTAVPTSGISEGGTLVSVYGGGFVNSLSLSCIFGEMKVKAFWLSSTSLQCYSPAHDIGAVLLRISNNGVDFVHEGVTFSFSAVPTISHIEPEQDYISGGALVTIYGKNFNARSSICRFGAATTNAVQVSTSTISCVAPSRTEPSVVSIEISLNGHDFTESGVLFNYVPKPEIDSMNTNANGGVRLSVSGYVSKNAKCRIGSIVVDATESDGNLICQSESPLLGVRRMELIDSNLNSLSSRRSIFHPVPSAWKLVPSSLPASGGAAVTVSGSNFSNIDTVTCKIGSVRVLATWISNTEVRCIAPRHVPSTVFVEVSNDGIAFSHDGLKLAFYSDPAVREIFPVRGPPEGATVVRVFGSRFIESSLFVCRFGSIIVPISQFVSSTQVICTSPGVGLFAGSVNVEVSNNNRTFTDNQVSFSIMPSPTVYLISPTFGPEDGNTLVTIKGANFLDVGRAFRCKFDESIVSAIFVSTIEATCLSPKHFVDTVSFSVTSNGQDYIQSGAKFKYGLRPTITGISHSMGFSFSGRSTVTIFGNGFLDTTTTKCRFGSIFSPANWINEKTLTCRTASMPPGQYSLQVTNNGYDFSSERVVFRVIPDISVKKLIPDHGLTVGGIPIFVIGSNFRNSTGLTVRFGSKSVRGHFISQNVISCVAPSTENVFNQSKSVHVDVSINAIDYTESAATFQYISDCPARKYCDNKWLLPCPNGTICQGTQNINFTLCGPGTYQPRSHQQRCLPCPVGFICPNNGLSAPVVCPSGFVCDSHGLTAPRDPCPAGHYCKEGTKSTNPLDFVGLREDEWVRDFETGLLYFNHETRDWQYRTRTDPATSFSRMEHEQFYKAPRQEHRNGGGNILLAERPHPCPEGTFCRAGVASGSRQYKNFSTPQSCMDGFYCPAGSATPQGKGPCPTGYYCPTGNTAIACPKGHYCGGVGNLKPNDCYPGTYNPFIAQSNCTLCPAGHICPDYNMQEPKLCPAGFVCMSEGLSHEVVQCPAGFYCSKGTVTIEPTRAFFKQYSWFGNYLEYDVEPLRFSLLNKLKATLSSTYSYISTAPLQPEPCPPGVFCLGGVASKDVTIDWVPKASAGAQAPQPCTEGAYCRFSSGSPAGTGACFRGHYCPPGSEHPTEAPLGTFASLEGSVVPTLCFPGTWAPLNATITCRLCPAGYTCGNYGTYVPEICLAGTYRSLADSVTCRLCPQGTFTQYLGVTDITMCEPCPPGRVCGVESMHNLTLSTACPAGHACGEGTTKLTQFGNPCSAGYWCEEKTSPDKQFDGMCEEGHYCLRGTKGYLKRRNKCSIGYFCPAGTSVETSEEIKCPKSTTSAIGTANIEGCKIQAVDVCDKDAWDNVYLSKFSYESNGQSIDFDSETQSTQDRTGEVEIVSRVVPINVSSSAKLWQNDTVEVFKVCPPNISMSGGDEVTVIGRNFYEHFMLTCRFWPVESNEPRYSPATFISKTRVKCKAPVWNNATIARIDVSNIGMDNYYSSGGAPVQYLNITRYSNVSLPEGAAYLKAYNERVQQCAVYDETIEGDREREKGWFMIKNQNTAQLSFDLRHIPDELVYGQHYRIAIYVNRSTCEQQKCKPGSRERVVQEMFLTRQNLYSSLEDHGYPLPCSKPIPLPNWFEQIPMKNDVINITLLALEDVLMKAEIQIIYSMFSPIAPHFLNTTSVDIRGPLKANSSLNFEEAARERRNLHRTVSFEQESVLSEYMFITIFKKEFSESVSLPLNLPPRFQDFETGRVLVMFNKSTDNERIPTILDPATTPNQPIPVKPRYKPEGYGVKVEPAYWNTPSDEEEAMLAYTRKYRENFQTISRKPDQTGFQYGFDEMALPYFPYFSNCDGFDSYIPVFMLLEHPDCQLPEVRAPFADEGYPRVWERRNFPPLLSQDEIKYVQPIPTTGIEPIADWCELTIQCHYEEIMLSRDVTPRWFEAESDATLFEFMRKPVRTTDMLLNLEGEKCFVDQAYFELNRDECLLKLQDYVAGSGKLIQDLLSSEGADAFLPVAVDRSAAADVNNECNKLCYPRSVSLEITYYQINPTQKRMIELTVVFDDFDFNAENTDYSLSLSYSALGYIALIVKFAFNSEIFILLFTVIGIATCFVGGLFYLTIRITTPVESPPKFRFLAFLKIIAPSPIVGVVLSMLPIYFVLFFCWLLILGGDTFAENPSANDWILDVLYGHYMDTKVDPDAVVPLRYGRMGTCFLILGIFLIFVGSKIFLPKRVSKREKEILMKRDAQAGKESVWVPTLWKRSNFMFTSIAMAISLVFIVEFSLWEDFGTYIWYMIIALRFVGTFIEIYVERALKESLLLCPCMTSFSLIAGLVTFGADDFKDFLLSYFVEFGMMLCERVFIDPSTKEFVDFFVDGMARTLKWIRIRLKIKYKTGLEKQYDREREEAEASRIRDAGIDFQSQDTVEPILDSYAVYANDTLALFYQPFIIILLIWFRAPIYIPELYGIREQDMAYYLFFSLCIIIFQLTADILVHHSQELFHGWKIYDYLVYTRYRFLQRETRWKGFEDSLDECIEEGMRTLDQMCFSSQFFLMSSMHTTGIMYIIIAVEMMLRQNHNLFGDPASLLIFPYVIAISYVSLKLFVWGINKSEFYKLKHEDTAWHSNLGGAEDDDFGIPRWDELDKIKGASHEAYLMNQKITSETFRHKFLDYNRPWLVSQLPAILTPRTLRRSRPYLVAQFTKILGSVNQDISSDSSSDDDGPVRFGPVSLSRTSRSIARMWLAQARRRKRLREVVQPLINRARKNECEDCLSRKQLQVHLIIPIEVLSDRFEKENMSDEFDQVAWKEFFNKHEKFKTLCLNCIGKIKAEELEKKRGMAYGVDISSSDDEDARKKFKPVFLRSTSKALLLRWYRGAQDKVRRRGGRVGRRFGDISDDDADEDGNIGWAKKRLYINAATKAMAIKWLRLARARKNTTLGRRGRTGRRGRQSRAKPSFNMPNKKGNTASFMKFK
jgi:hypothetical protein